MNYSKLLSGRWLLTLISGLVFAYVSIKGVLSAEAVASIISMVFIAYFQKNNQKETK